MFFNLNANPLTVKRKEKKKQTTTRSKSYVRAEIAPTIRDFSRGERQVLHVCIKSNDNKSSTK